jgi:hypothetical protein
MKFSRFLVSSFALASAFASLSFAEVHQCEGQPANGTRGTLRLSINKSKHTATVTGSYSAREYNESAERPEWKRHTVSYTGNLNNDGQSGIAKYNYYEEAKNSGQGISYLRISNDLEDKDDGTLDLATRGYNGHDGSGYSYLRFYCK